MAFNKLTSSLIAEITAAVGENAVFTDIETRDKCSRDYTEHLQFMPDIVVAPQNTEGVSALLKICNTARFRFFMTQFTSIY